MLADRIGGSRVTFVNFIVMTAASLGVVHAVNAHDFPLFMTLFLTLFVSTGLGNGSTYRMIPVIFRNQRLRAAQRLGRDAVDAALRAARVEGAAVLGFVAAVGACGGYVIPRAFGASIARTGSVATALLAFVGFYATCIVLTWICYVQRARAGAPEATGAAPAAAEARV